MLKFHITDIPLFEQHLRDKKRLAESSIYMYVKSVELFLSTNPDLGNLEEYNKYLIKYSIKKRTGHHYSALKNFIDWRIDDANLKNRLIEGMIKPPIRHDIKRERRHLSEERIMDVINALKHRKHRTIAIIQTLTGVRAGDVLRLKRGNIMSEEYREKPVLRLNILGKRNKRNVIYIHDEIGQNVIMDYVTSNYEQEGYYFLEKGTMRNRHGNTENEYMFTKTNYHRYWLDLKQALQTVGINREDFATHDFRRCFARRVWEKYKDIHVLQSLLNHTNPAVTLRYLEQSGLKNVDYHFEMQQ